MTILMGAIDVVPDASERPPGPQALRWGEAVRAEVAPGEVLIKVAAAGVNRADLLQRQGFYPPPAGASQILGLECSGTIAEVGAEVTGWQIGDACVALLAGGGYAEFVAVPAGQVMAPPPDVDLVTAAGVVEVAATVVSNLDEAALESGETFLVHGGSGGIGTFAIQYARARGARVIATAGSEEKVALCRKFGADHAMRYNADPSWVDQVHELGGVDVVLDPIGAKYLAQHVRILKRGGRLVTIGMQGGRKAELNLAALLGRNASVRATSLRGRPVTEKAAICARLVDQVWPLIGSGAIRTAPTTTIPLREAARAHSLLESGAASGKIVLVA